MKTEKKLLIFEWVSEYFYKLFIQRIQQEPVNCRKKWEDILETSVEDWHGIHSLTVILYT